MFLLPEGRKSLSAFAYHVGPARFYQPAYRFIAADIGTTEGAWLDVGCGPGWLAIHAGSGKPDLDVVGIDTSETMIQLAEQNKAGRLNVTFRKMDGADIIYPVATFDTITAVQVAHHWTETARVLGECHRVLKPGGKLYVYEADPEGEIPSDWIQRVGVWPPDSVLRSRWKKNGMDAARWGKLLDEVRGSAFGGSVADERHGFYRRAVCTKVDA